MSRAHISEMRQRLGLKEDDDSRDVLIEEMTPEQRLRLICGWHLGDSEWAETFLDWARDAGYEITEPKPSS